MSYYSIVQYIPDAVRDERINIGVIAWKDQQVETRFLVDWGRVEVFAQVDDIGFLRQIVEELKQIDEKALQDTFRRQSPLDTIRFGPPMGSILSVTELADDAAHRFLVGRVRKSEGNWLKEVLEDAEADMKNWPAWMRREIGRN